MSRHAATLLAELRSQGVELAVVRDILRGKGPGRALTATAYQKITYYEAELIELLSKQQPTPEPVTPVDPAEEAASGTEATFPGNLRVQIRPEGRSRWFIWFTHGGAWRRREDSATPYLDHARRTAERWYGQPAHGWRAPEEGN